MWLPFLVKKDPNAKFVFLFLGLIVTFVLMGAGSHYQHNKICKSVDIYIDAPADNHFFDKHMAQQLIGVDYEILGAKMNEVSLSGIEERLLATKYIKAAHAFFGGDGRLQLKLKLREPVARIYNMTSHKSFYIDAEGYIMPQSPTHSARTLLICGTFADSLILASDTLQDSLLTAMLPMINYINQNSFWRAQLSELYIDKNNEIIATTQVGDARIYLGNMEEYTLKLEKLFHFYKKVVNRLGWNYYQAINLKYNNQIIGVKRKAISGEGGTKEHQHLAFNQP